MGERREFCGGREQELVTIKNQKSPSEARESRSAVERRYGEIWGDHSPSLVEESGAYAPENTLNFDVEIGVFCAFWNGEMINR